MAAAAGVPPGGVGGGGGGGRQHLSAAPAEVARFFADVRTALERHPSLCGAGGVGAAFLFRIREPPLAWRVDLRSAPGGVRQLPDGGAGQDCDCVIEYRAAGDLAAINAGRLDLRKALILQRLKISGNLKALQRFHESMDAVKKRDAADEAARRAAEVAERNRLRAPTYARGSVGGTTAAAAAGRTPATPSPAAWSLKRVIAAPFSSSASKGAAASAEAAAATAGAEESARRWESDEAVKRCTRCDAGFSLLRRRHHCRACGRIFCQKCSSNTVGERRVCDFCMAKLSGAAPPDGVRLLDPAARSASMASTFSPGDVEVDSAPAGSPSSASPPPPARGAFATPAAAVMAAAPPAPQAAAEAAAAAVAGDGTGAPDGSGGGESMLDGGAPALAGRVAELEAALERMRASLRTVQAVPEAGMPTLAGVVARSEVLALLWLPALLLFASLGWAVVPCATLAAAAWAASAGAWWRAGVLLAVTAAAAAAGGARGAAAELFRRRMRVYGAAAVLVCDYRLTRAAVAAARYGAGSAAAEGAWEAAHVRNAQRALRLMLDLRGLWVKCGQYLSSRPDVMPRPYVEELAALQDAMPARPLREMVVAIEEALRRPIAAVFASLDERALASASIGQVHRGRLLDGTEVAVKVQHRGMDVTIAQDLDNLNIILSWLSWVDIGFDLKGVMQEWLKEVVSELDFTLEARNMTEVRANLARTGVLATVPRVIPGLVARGVLVMRYVAGVKVNDRDRLARLGIDRDVLVARICRAYAHNIYRDGLFNSDPHPGNFFVARLADLVAGDAGDTAENDRLLRIAARRHAGAGAGAAADTAVARETARDEWVPVLLDFGLCKRLPPRLRLAFGKLVLAAEEVDFAMMMEASDDMGMTFSKESAAEDLENLRHMFRNATPASEARARNEERERSKKDKAEARAAATAAKAPAAAAAAGAKAEADRRVTAWPSDLMFFLRASELLQGLCSHLETRHPFMHTMARAARLACLDRFAPAARLPRGVHVLAPLPPPAAMLRDGEAAAAAAAAVLTQMHALRALRSGGGGGGGSGGGSTALAAAVPPTSPSHARLEGALRARLAALGAAGAFVGCQVVVLQAEPGAATAAAARAPPPRVLACVAAGHLGSADLRPVTPASLFPALGASRLGVAAAVTVAASRSTPLADIDAVRVEAHWPDWGAHGKGDCSVGELLRGRSGVEGVLPPALTVASLTRAKWAAGAAAVAAAPPLLLPRMAEAVHGDVGSSSGDGGGGGGYDDNDAAVHDDSSAAERTSTAPPPPTPAFSAPPAPLDDVLFFPTTGRPNIGPDVDVERTAHLWFGWGWAVGSLLAGWATPSAAPLAADGATALSVLLRDGVEPACGLRGHLTFGALPVTHESTAAAPPDGSGGGGIHTDVGPAATALITRMATLSLGANLAVNALAGAAAGDAAALAAAETAAAAASAAAATAQSDAAAVLEAEADDDAHAHLSSADDEANEVTMAAALAAVELAEGMARDGRGGLADLADLAVAGREHFLDPRLANTIKLRMALLPSAGLYASALGLAHAVDFCARVHVQALHARMAGAAAWARARTAAATGAGGADAARVAFSCPPPQPAHAAVAASVGRSGRLSELVDLRAVWAAHYTGLRLFGFRRGGGDGEAGPHDHVSAFGVVGLGGTLALHDVPSGISIAITVNQLAADASVTQHLLRLVCAELGLGVPREADLV